VKITKALRDAARRNYEGLSGSRTFCLLWNEQMVDEVIPLLQMGLAVYLDKPIVVLLPKGRVLTGNVRAMATAIEEYDPDDPASLDAAVERLLRNGKM
jgi:hypothetical protein